MAYTKQNWATGETITADKLNHMEDGIAEGGSVGGGVFVVNFTPDMEIGKITADKTFEEIMTVAESMPVIGFMTLPGEPGVTLILGSTSPLQFANIYGDYDFGAMYLLTAEYDDITDEPTGYWLTISPHWDANIS